MEGEMRRREVRSSEAGFSIVEGLIASVILLIVILGVLPLVTQSMVNNAQGNTSSEQANGIVDGMEQVLSLPFDAPEMTVPSGQTSFVQSSYRMLDDLYWRAGTYSGTGTPQFTRTGTVEIFTVNDIDNNGDYTFDDPQDGSLVTTDPNTVAFKRVTMTVGAERVFSSNLYRVTVIQAF